MAILEKGTKVKIIDNTKQVAGGPNFVVNMKKYWGCITTIRRIIDERRVKLGIDGGKYNWDPNWLEPLTEKKCRLNRRCN